MTSSSARSSFPTSLLSTLQTLQTPRILLLHGSHQTASILQDRLQRLTTALQTLHPTPTLIYLNAPHTLPLIPGDALPLRTWSTNTCICVSLATIDEAWKRGGGFDGVIGFSEGAAVGVVVASLRERFKGLGWGVFVGVPKVIPCHYNVGEVGIPALVVTGQGDTLVPSDESVTFCKQVFSDPQMLMHPGGHSIPVRGEDLKVYKDFIVQCSRVRSEVDEEICSLSAIYGDDFFVIDDGDGDVCARVGAIRVSTEETRWCHREMFLAFRVGGMYPDVGPGLKLVHEMGMLEFTSSMEMEVMGRVYEAVATMQGEHVLYEAACTARQALLDLHETLDQRADQVTDDADAEDDTEVSDDAFIEITGPTLTTSKSSRGPWRHVIGLVGKPSAGKSTFFNCATRSTLARVAPHPFTTIDPNIGVGYWAVPNTMIPSAWKSNNTRVLLPCLVKDVAGLVPGACQGRGRGNQFLNDLCDADVLIHVVDASGMSDPDGNLITDDTSTTDPLHDIKWVKQELREWILGNLLRKWDSVLRRPSKLIDMFSGYQAPRHLIDGVVRKAGLDPSVDTFTARKTWTHSHAGRCVDVFLEARFPILLALNKCDVGTSATHIPRILATLDDERVLGVPVSAASEAWLQLQTRGGVVEYVTGMDQFKVVGDTTMLPLSWDVERKRVEDVLKGWKSTGVLEAITAAVMLRPPLICHPVVDLDAVVPVLWDGMEGLPCAALTGEGSFVAMKPGSRVEDLFKALRGLGVVGGQFVRCEGMRRDGGGRRRIGKEEEMDEGCAVLRVLGNRKSLWQRR